MAVARKLVVLLYALGDEYPNRYGRTRDRLCGYKIGYR